ncbi:histidine phosphatase superfamily [Flammula alnicola]|nr:histidine phosphatase superfamily [Flammula alnicola]
MVHFLLIRHGESKDNLRGVWAGWKDSPLSNHGMRQAEALADDLARTKLSAIYSSDLSRAKTTASAVKNKQLDPTMPFHESTLLREQNFGAGEGMKFAKKEKGMSVAAHYAQGKFPALYTRGERFPGGESLDDMAKRAEIVIDEILFPHALEEKEDGTTRTVAIVSHGLFIGELLAAVIRRDRDYRGEVDIRNLRGMKNTAWTKFEVVIKAKHAVHEEPLSSTPTALTVKVTGVNRHAHLSNLHRQKGGIGSLAHDPAQQDIRAFLGNPTTKAPRQKPY